MKTSILSMFFALFALLTVHAQNPVASPRVSAESGNIKIEYGQPSKKGRVIFGNEESQSLEKYGKLWRIGANQSTEITFKKDGQFGGKSVKAGSYSLFAIPNEKEWTLILNSELKQRGASQYEETKVKDVLRINVPAKKFKNSAEKLTFKVTANAVEFQWDQEGFSVPVKF